MAGRFYKTWTFSLTFLLLPPKHSTSDYFHLLACYFFLCLAIWLEIEILKKKKSSKCYIILLLAISVSLNHMGKEKSEGNDKKEGTDSQTRDFFLAMFFWWGVEAGEIYKALQDPHNREQICWQKELDNQRNLYVYLISYGDLWKRVSGHTSCVQFPSRKLAVAARDKRHEWL